MSSEDILTSISDIVRSKSDLVKSNFNIREITTQSSDYIAYMRLISQLTSQYKLYSHDIYTGMINELKRDPTTLIFLLEIENKIVGTIKIIVERKFYHEKCYVAHIEDVVVDQEYRGKGYGKYLIDFAIEICQRTSLFYKILLYCSDHNVKFYEKCGFSIEGANLCKRLN